MHPRFAPLELAFTGPAVPIPADVEPLRVRFAHADGGTVDVPGFWDGGDRYVVRFAPGLEGGWSWRSTSDAPALHDREGAFEVGPAASGEHGPVRIAGRYHFAHADGTPFRPVGATVYNWLHQEEPLFTQTVEAVAAAGMNKLRFMVFPQAGGYVEHFPELLPFERDADGAWDVARPVPQFFRRLEGAVRTLGAAGIQAEVLVYNAYDYGRFGLDGLTEEQDAAYLRYLVARLSAFPNVWWSLCNEFDQIDRPDERWDAAGVRLAGLDPYDHPRSIHNLVRLFDHNRPWVTHASLQLGQATEDFGRASLFRDAYRKPVVLDEIKYEGDVPDRWGHLGAEELVHQFWITTVSGCYASHGESFVIPSGSLHIVEGGPFVGQSPARLGFLRGILDDVDGAGLDPIDNWWDDAFVAGVDGRTYLQYLGRSAPEEWAFRLPIGWRGVQLAVGDRFEVDVIDTWNMTVTPVGRVFELDEVAKNDAYARGARPVALPAGEALALRVRRVG
ncbi:apiosidase-like domain-containing protein [Agromyces chitinivorans]|uniref:apiosidase-like domain-containing protein n=1 Tax=Agromyces chitinivorans TaxID=3158560 RepID=UPI0033956089